ncbi:MAG: UDP-N-acetylmuramate dehydrogenase [Lachnospiraceae bacterium]|nr:UDP-N-acetylmuramate dehydrogenase [Lachnospiraceae bacterium]MBP5184051.1 UDP-N-acetylmuramate dehydrogenase [Lachnospiraceae bacterium]
MDLFKELKAAVEGRVLKDEPMSLHTTFKVGGPADYFMIIKGADELAKVEKILETYGVPAFVVGNGSNLLVSDEGIRGCVITFERPEYPIRIYDKSAEGVNVEIPAGTLLSAAAKAVAREGLKGFEFAAGIPGTLGGAVLMNAGAYGGEIKDSILTAKVFRDGEILTLSKDELSLSYRHSSLMETGGVILSAEFFFEYGDKDQIFARIEELNAKRREKQPLEYPSAGSTFKRPEGYFAGKLIQDAGLAGFSVGGAAVSEKHCGFVINKGGATASDVKKLIDEVIQRVQESAGVTLEPEVRFMGF